MGGDGAPILLRSALWRSWVMSASSANHFSRAEAPLVTVTGIWLIEEAMASLLVQEEAQEEELTTGHTILERDREGLTIICSNSCWSRATFISEDRSVTSTGSSVDGAGTGSGSA